MTFTNPNRYKNWVAFGIFLSPLLLPFLLASCTTSLEGEESAGTGDENFALRSVASLAQLEGDPRYLGETRALTCPNQPGVVRVTDYRARPNQPSEDNWKPIQDALGAVPPGGMLCFPAGRYYVDTYLSTTPPFDGRRAALEIVDRNGLTVRFETGAELIINNLNTDGSPKPEFDPRDPARDHLASIHGVLIENSSSIRLEQVKVRWHRDAKSRHTGDGLRIVGDPDPNRASHTILVQDLGVRGAPQTGVVAMGVKDFIAQRTVIRETRADAFHLNANHGGVRVNDLTVLWEGRDAATPGNPTGLYGDDGLAFVTYLNSDLSDPANPWKNGEEGVFPLNSPDLTTRNNQDSIASNIVIKGGRANGIRLGGASDVTVKKAYIENREWGVTFSSSFSSRYGCTPPQNCNAINQNMLASRNVFLEGIRIVNPRQGGVSVLFNHGDNLESHLPEGKLGWFKVFSFHLKRVLVLADSTVPEQVTVQRAWGLASQGGMRFQNFKGISPAKKAARFFDARRVHFQDSLITGGVRTENTATQCQTATTPLTLPTDVTFHRTPIPCP